MMKFLVLIVALVITTGSRASAAPERVSKVKELRDSFKGLPMLSIVIWGMADRSKTAPELSDLYHNVSRQLSNFRREIPSEIKEPLELVGSVLEGVIRKTYRAVIDLSNKQDIEEPLIDGLSYYFDSVLERMEPYFESFRPILNDELRYIDAKLPEYFKPLDDQLFFYLKKLEDAQPTLQAAADQTLTRIRQGLEALHKNLNPYLKPLLEESKKHQTEFWEWVHAPIFPPDP
uniref:Apolipoprotein A-I-like n=1 Tax=Pogona vitticeps TaxID=103695 RepID=A0A6J0SII7_9SAUR